MHFAEAGVIMLAMLFVATIRCDDCPAIPKHYEELGCKAIKDDREYCTKSYDCTEFLNEDTSMCHLKGKAYKVYDRVDANDLPSNWAACTCAENSAFNCAVIECPRIFDPDCPECVPCIFMYENVNETCPSKAICDEKEIAKLPMCFSGDSAYYLGQTFNPTSHPCHECICTEDYDNVTAIEENANCIRLDCGIELEISSHIREGCVPIYFGEKDCCPISYKCPTDEDEIMENESEPIMNDPNDSACSFGKLWLQVGQQLDMDAKTLECKCIIPPMITCKQFPICVSD